ncbi:MAG: hypothetical protein ACFCUI_07395 [Bernardetiaceae bacterium]
MNIRKVIIGGIIIGLLPLLSMAQDFDDVYFTKADRVAIQQSKQKPKRSVSQSSATRPSGQAQFQNPDYAGTDFTSGYDYFRQEDMARFRHSQGLWNNSFAAFSPMMMGGFSPMMMGGMGFYDPFWGMGMGFGPSFGMMSMYRFGWGNPWRMGGMGMGMGFYDPFWNGFTGWNRFGNPYYCPPVVVVGGQRPSENVRTRATAPRYNRATNVRSGTGTSPTRAQRYGTPNDSNRNNGRRSETATPPTRRGTDSRSTRPSYTPPTRSGDGGGYTPSRSRSSSPSYTPSRGGGSYTPSRSTGGGSRSTSGGGRRGG